METFCSNNSLTSSMSRRGNCYDDAAMESFFSSLNNKKIRYYIFKAREEVMDDIFDYTEVFYK